VLGKRSAVPSPDLDPALRDATVPVELVEAAGLAVWRFDLGTRGFDASSRLYELLGHAVPPVDDGLAVLEQHIPVDDLPAFRAAWEDGLGKGRIDCEVRVRRRDGRIAWIQLLGRRTDSGGTPVVCGVLHDITSRHTAASVGADPEQRLQSLFDMGGIGIAQADPLSGRLLRANDRLSEMVGQPQLSLVGRRTITLLHPDDRAAHVAGMQRLLRGEVSTFEVEARLLRRDGGSVWVLMAAGLWRDAAGVPRVTTVAVLNIGERKRAEQALAERVEQRRLLCD
jgi:PAS domain S-box-containing protein